VAVNDQRREGDHAETYRRLLERWRAGDLIAVQRAMAPNVVMGVGGQSALAGQYQGSIQVITFTAAMTQWFLPVSVETIELGETPELVRVVSKATVRSWEREGRFDMETLVHFNEAGLIDGITLRAIDQARFDRFLALRGEELDGNPT
jgi:hypothetical protein